MKNIYKSIGQKIRTARKAQDMTLEDLSNEADIDWSFLARIETGKAVPSLQTLYTISKILGISLSQLFEAQNISAKTQDTQRLQNLFDKLSDKNKKKVFQIIKLITE
ncbi:MAG: helix-turn-helix domain-containing protein [Endomicrobia bacterium]|nr:helix-turn-helix domain-containing protein [Endomicrobiia bacterium]MCL2506399.1 helix-turn-helix domain-containing protein [Endomicrobiia bacterium]